MDATGGKKEVTISMCPPLFVYSFDGCHTGIKKLSQPSLFWGEAVATFSSVTWFPLFYMNLNIWSGLGRRH